MSAQASRREQQRIEQLLAQLEALPEPQARSCARQLVQGVLDLHGIGLARLVDMLMDFEPAGPALLDALAQDESVAALLLLHGLHPQPVEQRVVRALERLHAELGVRGFAIDLLGIDAQRVRLKMRGMPQHGPVPAGELQREIEEAVFALAPEIAAVEIEDLARSEMQELKFIPQALVRADAAASGS